MTDIVDKMREAHLRWFGHVQRGEGSESARMALEMEVEEEEVGQDRGGWIVLGWI